MSLETLACGRGIALQNGLYNYRLSKCEHNQEVVYRLEFEIKNQIKWETHADLDMALDKIDEIKL